MKYLMLITLISLTFLASTAAAQDNARCIGGPDGARCASVAPVAVAHNTLMSCSDSLRCPSEDYTNPVSTPAAPVAHVELNAETMKIFVLELIAYMHYLQNRTDV